MFESQAVYSDSNNESDYREFEDSDYEDDILFDRNVDSSVETFSVNANENTRTNDDSREFISQELQKHMQNEDGDSDCVVSSDTKSLNSDSDASNEDFNFPKHNPKTDGSNPKLALGQVFQNKKEFKEAVTTHEVKRGRTVEWIKDDSERARGRCKHRPSCEWVILASKMHRDTNFQIKTYNSEHTCFCWNVKNKNVTSSWIAKKYMDKKSNRDWKTSKFRDEVSRALGVDVSLCQARKAKKKAISLIDGNLNDQFNMLWNYINEIVRSNPGTSVYMELKPNETPNNPSRFQRLYICFAACKEGFKAGCRKIVGVDGCWLKDSMYGAQLLAAVGLDGNNNIFPIAYAIVEKECNDTWQWFLNYLMIDIEIEEQCLWTFMSDKQKGLLEAFEKVLPNVSHRFCARHLHNNFKKAGFSGHTLKDAFWEAARATTVEAFNVCMLKILELDKEAHEWLSTKLPNEWSRSHFSPLSKCDVSLNNVCEVFNSLILDARDKPIIKLLETIRHILMSRVGTNRDKAEKWASGDICPTIKKKLHRNMKELLVIFLEKPTHGIMRSLGLLIMTLGLWTCLTRYVAVENGNYQGYLANMLFMPYG
nr:PREDICTED: uncharacterized protein LOC107791451 [Nicotiana tabacum]